MIKSPGLFVRLFVVIYDALLLAGVVFFTHSIVFLALKILPEPIAGSLIIKTLHFTFLLFVTFLFYGWFWVNGGQTLGMKAWHLFLVDEETGKYITWQIAGKRYVFALLSWLPLGMGFVWILIRPDNRTWHDVLSKTLVVKHKVATK